MSLVLICPPVMTVKTCRIAAICPSNNNVYQLEILEAPPVEVNILKSNL